MLRHAATRQDIASLKDREVCFLVLYK